MAISMQNCTTQLHLHRLDVRARAQIVAVALMASIGYACQSQSAVAAGNELAYGVQLYNSGRYAQALPLLENAVRRNPRDANRHYYLGLCYQALKQTSLAKQQFDWVASSAPDPTLRSYAQKALGSFVAPKAAGSVSLSPPPQTTPNLVANLSRNQGAGGSASTANSSSSASAASSSGSSASRPAGRCKAIMFETSWCHYCREFAPQFDEAADKYRGSMDFERVDCEQNPDLAAKYKIKGYPTMIYLDGRGNMIAKEGTNNFANRVAQLTGRQ